MSGTHRLLTEQPGWQRLDQAEHAEVAEERTRAEWTRQHVRSDLRRQRADYLARVRRCSPRCASGTPS
jgi:hypothetical protein